jgi:3-oxoacyl-[acyl-carrier protein] reductase
MRTPISAFTGLLPGIIEEGWSRVVKLASLLVKLPILMRGQSNVASRALTSHVMRMAGVVAPFVHGNQQSPVLRASC